MLYNLTSQCIALNYNAFRKICNVQIVIIINFKPLKKEFELYWQSGMLDDKMYELIYSQWHTRK